MAYRHEQHELYHKKYYLDNREEIVRKMKARAATPEGRKARMLTLARQRAKKSGFEFALKASDITLPTHCPILGIELRYEEDADLRAKASLDRIDSKLGYVPGNIQVISNLANRMKQDASREELLRFAEYFSRQLLT